MSHRQVGKLSAPFALPAEIEARELKIRDYFLEEVEKLINEKYMCHIKNLAMVANVTKDALLYLILSEFLSYNTPLTSSAFQSEVMRVQLDTSEAKRDKCETTLLEALSNCGSLQKEKETQEGNYKSQLNTMSEHLANMNEKLIFQTEEIQQLKFVLANKVRRKNAKIFPGCLTDDTISLFFFQNSKKGKQK